MNERTRAGVGVLAMFLSVSLAAQTVVFHGRVVGSGGGGLAGASLRAVHVQPGERRELSRTTTAADGVFHLPGVAPGVTIEVSADGCASRELVFVGASTPSLIELAATGFVGGRVVDPDGKPIAAEVVIEYVGCVPTPVALGDDGRFHETLRAAGRYRLRARAAERREVETEWQEAPRDGVELVLVPAATKTVRVRAKDAKTGEAVRDFEVVLAWSSLRGDPYSYIPVVWKLVDGDAVAGVDGEAALRVFAPLPPPPNRPVLGILAKGYALTIVENLFSLEIPLEREGVIEGVVRDARTQQPLAAVEVWSEPCLTVPGGGFYGDLHYPGGRPWGAVRSGVDGRFRLTQLAAGDHVVHARLADRPAQREVVHVLAGETVASTLAMSAGGRATVTLTGGELPRATEVRVVPDADPHRLRLEPVADGAATFIGLPGGRCQVMVRWPATLQQGDPVDVWLGAIDVRDDGDHRQAFDVRGKEPGVVRGRLTIRGSLSPDRLLVTSVGGLGRGAQVPTRLALYEGWRAPVAIDGRFELRLPFGPHRLRVIDVATGLVVHLDREITVPPGPLQRDLEIAPARLQVRAPSSDRLWIALPASVSSDDPAETIGVGTPDLLPGSGDRELFVWPTRVSLWRGDGAALECGVTLDLQPGERRAVELPAKEH